MAHARLDSMGLVCAGHCTNLGIRQSLAAWAAWAHAPLLEALGNVAGCTSLRDLRHLGSAWAHAPVLAGVGSAARCTNPVRTKAFPSDLAFSSPKGQCAQPGGRPGGRHDFGAARQGS